MSIGDGFLETTRRGFLRSLGMSAASLAACQRLPVEHALPYLVAPEGIVPGVPLFYAGTCVACDAGCGMLSKALDGRPIKLEGNPAHPLSRGGLCAIGQGQLRELYDPGRLQGPFLRGQSTTWGQLDRTVRDGIADLSGDQIWILTRSVTSPAARRAVQAFVQETGARWVEHDLDPQRPSAVADAYELLSGSRLVPEYRLGDVDLLVSFGADLLATGPDPVVSAAEWAARRRQADVRGPLRHLQIEGSLSLTGANADERWPATSTERTHLALWLLRQVAERSSTPAAAALTDALASLQPGTVRPDAIAGLAEELLGAAGASLIVSSANRLDEQLAVALLNDLLGNQDRALALGRPPSAETGADRQLAALLQALSAGTVGAAIIVDLDLVGRLPGSEELAGALSRVPTTVAISRRATQTTAACTAVVASHHPLESWNDAERRAGLRTLAQPSVRPLFDTRHPYESFLHWTADAGIEWLDHLRSGWVNADTGEPGADAAAAAAWSELVRTGGLGDLSLDPGGDTAAGEGAPAVLLTLDGLPVATLRAAAEAAPPVAGGLEVELLAEVSSRGGDHAANPWLRELPDPLTRVAWNPCVRVAPQRAREMGIEDGDEFDIVVGSANVRLPAVLLPGQHPDVLGLPLGYGDGTDAEDCDARGDRVAQLVAFDSSGYLAFRDLAASATATAGTAALPRVQVTLDARDRPVIHQLNSYDESVHAPHYPDADMWPERAPSSPHWEMVVDLDACIGCGGCVIACQAENNIPVVGPERIAEHRDMHWLRIDRYFSGSGESPDVLFEPMMCAQCDHAPCETVCPVAATVHGEDGLNHQIYNRCVGTRYCANNCPYKVRRFNWFDFQPRDPVERLVLNPDVVVRSRGVMEKCTFCVQRIQAARIASRRDGVEFEVATACQQSCPSQAITFGDGTKSEDAVSSARQTGRAFQVLAELGVRPSVTYLARVRTRDEAEPAMVESVQTHGGDA